MASRYLPTRIEKTDLSNAFEATQFTLGCGVQKLIKFKSPECETRMKRVFFADLHCILIALRVSACDHWTKSQKKYCTVYSKTVGIAYNVT